MKNIIVCGYDFRTPASLPDRISGFVARAFDDRTKAVQFAEKLASLGPSTRQRKLPDIRAFIEGGTNHVELCGVDVAILENA